MDYSNGFGFPTFCDQENEDLLRGAREIDKLAFATATTITALIPILISVQKLPTTSIHELALRDYGLLAIVTAGLTFGLPVVQESSGMAIKASDYLRNDFSHNNPVGNGYSPTQYKKYVFSGVFVVLQLLFLIVPAFLSHHTTKSQDLSLWACGGSGDTAWHMGFFLPIPVVGIAWYCFLRWTHHTDGCAKTNGQLVIYYRRHWIQPVAPLVDQLPGLAQMLMTVYFTFLFSTIYGGSVKVALLRVILVAIFLFVSRTASLWFARAANEWDSRLLVRCESEYEADDVLSCWNTRQHPERHSSQYPSSEVRQLSPPLSPSPSPSQAATAVAATSMPSTGSTGISKVIPLRKPEQVRRGRENVPASPGRIQEGDRSRNRGVLRTSA